MRDRSRTRALVISLNRADPTLTPVMLATRAGIGEAEVMWVVRDAGLKLPAGYEAPRKSKLVRLIADLLAAHPNWDFGRIAAEADCERSYVGQVAADLGFRTALDPVSEWVPGSWRKARGYLSAPATAKPMIESKMQDFEGFLENAQAGDSWIYHHGRLDRDRLARLFRDLGESIAATALNFCANEIAAAEQVGLVTLTQRLDRERPGFSFYLAGRTHAPIGGA